jgi:hypothetical protein
MTIRWYQIRSSIDTRCKSSSSLPDSIRREVCVTNRQSKREFLFFLTCELTLHAGLQTPTILLTAYQACPRRSTVCALRLRGGQRCVRRGRETMASVLRLLPRLFAGQRKKGVLMSSVRLRTVSYVVYPPCFDGLVAKRPTERHAPSFQSNHHTHRGHHGTFL